MHKRLNGLLVCLLLFTSGLFADELFYDIYKKHTKEEIYKGLKARYNLAYPAKHLAKKQYGLLADGYMQLFPVGPLQMWAIAIPSKKFLVVYYVESEGIAENYKLQQWDEIHAVNGQLFSTPHTKGYDVGEIGPVKEFGEALDVSQQSGELALTIIRDGKEQKLSLKIEKLGSFTASYPSDCPKSKRFTNEVLGRIHSDAMQQFCSNGYSQQLMGLSLLASGEAKYLDGVFKYVERSLPKNDKMAWNQIMRVSEPEAEIKGGLKAWPNGFNLILCAEYFWATGDEKIFPVLQRLAYSVSDQFQNPFGAFGHNHSGLGTYNDITFGPAGALNIVGLALAEKCGVKIEHKTYHEYYNYLSNNLINDIRGKDKKLKIDNTKYYGVGYNHRVWVKNKPGMWESGLNTASAALALMLMPEIEESRKLAAKLIEHLRITPHASTYIHSTPSLGLFWTTMLQSGFDREGLRTSLDYRKFWLTQSRNPKKFSHYFHPKVARMATWGKDCIGGGWDGDGHLNLQGAQLYSSAALLISNRRKLLMHGNSQRNWLNPKKKPQETLAFIDKYHSFFAEKLLEKAALLTQNKHFVEADKVYQRLLENYTANISREAIAKNYGLLKQKVGDKKLAYMIEEAEAQACMDYIEKHNRLSDSYKTQLRKYVTDKYKNLDIFKKTESQITVDTDPKRIAGNQKRATTSH